MTAKHDNGVVLADQTGEAMQFVADVRDIAPPNPGRRTVVDAATAAARLKDETLSRVDAVLRAHSGEPVVLLSGGVDSILVAAAAVELGVRPRAVTVVSSGGTDETNATAAAAALGLTHAVVELDQAGIVALTRTALSRLETPELWEVSYAIPLLATLPALDQIGEVGPILTGSAADAIFAGGKALRHPIDSPEAVDELDAIIRKESANNFVYDRLIPDFYPRVMRDYADRFIHVFQTVRMWELAESLAPPALFGSHDGAPVDKLCVRLACEDLLPGSAKELAWAKKAAIQRSAGIMGQLATAARSFAAAMPGATEYGDPMTEPYETVAMRLFLAILELEQQRKGTGS
ncbi:asparagine synthase-related protein [Nocardia sp. NPDC052316]|uniref:asparagine synthase-related protein n=1 Tax=Nocardia sp. NPDC052316 TaxID=3364329 RepID=UPI0037C75A2F